MVNKLIALGLLLMVGLGSCAVMSAVMRPTVDTVANRVIDEHYKDDPLDDAIRVYTTVRDGNSRGWMAFALFLVAGSGVLAYLFFLRLQPDYLKRKISLLRELRRGKQHDRNQSPRSWVVQPPPTLPRVDEVPMLTDGRDEDGRNRWVN